MFRPSGLFKSVACPRIATCSLQNCLFSHQAEQVSPPPLYASAPTVTSTARTEAKAATRNSRSPDPPPPPKRRRIDDGAGKSAEAPSNPAKPAIKSILKKPSLESALAGTSKGLAENRGTASDANRQRSSPPPPSSSFDSEDGRFIKVRTTDKNTGSVTKTKLDRVGTRSILVSSSSLSKPSKLAGQALRHVHSAAETKPEPTDVTTNLLNFGKAPPPREPERLYPRTVPGSKLSFTERHTNLTLLHAQFVRLDQESQKNAAGKQRLIKLANDEEASIANREKQVYANLIRTRLYKLTRMDPEAFKRDQEERQKERLKDKMAETAAEGVDTGLTPEAEALAIAGYVHPFNTLKAYDYVMLPPSDLEIQKSKEGVEAAAGEEECERCKGRFKLLKTPDEETDSWTTGGKCTHHYGRSTLENGQRRWSCCHQPAGETPGCSEKPGHVFLIKSPQRLASIWQFVETPAPPEEEPSEEATPKIEKAICMDCEMAFTTKGFELIRLTATRFPTYDTIIDILVQPYGEILDLNTRFSGVTEEQFNTAPPYKPEHLSQLSTTKTLFRASSPLEAREILFKHINASTIIIGHSLENDLKSTRIIHPRVVDTAILYKHRYPGLRYSLKHLVQYHLGRYIQLSDNDKGHDSREDANEAGNLVRKRVKGDIEKGKLGKDGIWMADAVFEMRAEDEKQARKDEKKKEKEGRREERARMREEEEAKEKAVEVN